MDTVCRTVNTAEQSLNCNTVYFSVEEIHSVGTINNVETSYFTQLKMLLFTLLSNL